MRAFYHDATGLVTGAEGEIEMNKVRRILDVNSNVAGIHQRLCLFHML